MNKEPLISVVVIGRNEGVRLARCLEAVRRMRFTGAAELIYVDSASTDKSVEVARSFGASVLNLIASRPSAARARNAGWRCATGYFVLFLDGDTITDPCFVERSLPSFQTPEVAVVWGNRREIDPGQSLYTGVLDLDWIWPAGDSLYCGGDALMRRSVLTESGGFDDDLIAGEEPALCRRIRALGYRIVHLDVPMTRHDLALTRWGQYWNRSVRTGHAYAEVAARFRHSGDPLWRAESRGNLLRGIVYLLTPVLALSSAALLRSIMPLIVVLLAAILLIARAANRKRGSKAGIGLLLTYGLHSHLQQIPIFIGQASFWWNRIAGKQRRLIEYREDAR